MSNSNHESDADDLIATVLFTAMIERARSTVDDPDERYEEYVTLSTYLDAYFPKATKRLRGQHNAELEIPF